MPAKALPLPEYGHLVRRLAEFTGLTPGLIEDRLKRRADTIMDWGAGPPPDSILEAVLNHETYFFRHPEQWRLLNDRILPMWARTPRPGGRVVWCAGCATGEEPWSLVALAVTAGLASDLHLLATDISRISLDRAIAGHYRRDISLGSFRDLPDFAGPSFPVEPGALWSVPEAWRPMVDFRLHNLTDPAPLARVDLILCRNVLIYFDDPTTLEVMRRFAEVLVEGGFLLLGPAEVARPGPCFERVESEGAVFFRRTGMPL